MEILVPLLALSFGLLIRLAFPIAVTFVLVYFLRKLDVRWQKEADAQRFPMQKPECSKIKKCTTEQRQACPAFTSSTPCWQVFRSRNGYLYEECISCKVFLDAPIPKVNVYPRRV